MYFSLPHMALPNPRHARRGTVIQAKAEVKRLRPGSITHLASADLTSPVAMRAVTDGRRLRERHWQSPSTAPCVPATLTGVVTLKRPALPSYARRRIATAGASMYGTLRTDKERRVGYPAVLSSATPVRRTRRQRSSHGGTCNDATASPLRRAAVPVSAAAVNGVQLRPNEQPWRCVWERCHTLPHGAVGYCQFTAFASPVSTP